MTSNAKKTSNHKSGMTLLELTVVALVLLSLVSIIAIGASTWKRGSDRCASILQIRNVQQAVRAYANANGVDPGQTPSLPEGKSLKGEIFGAGKFISIDPTSPERSHPGGSNYSFSIPHPTIVPPVGELYMNVTGPNAEIYLPGQDDVQGW